MSSNYLAQTTEGGTDAVTKRKTRFGLSVSGRGENRMENSGWE